MLVCTYVVSSMVAIDVHGKRYQLAYHILHKFLLKEKTCYFFSTG